MKQQLGLDYTLNTPLTAIISNRLVDVQQTYGGMALLGAITRIQRKSYKSMFNKNEIQYWTDLHIGNLCETYGKDKVVEVYNMIFKLDNSKKVG